MGKQKKLCWKCKGRHLAPTGAKCEQSGLSVNAVGSVVADSGAGSEGEMDSYIIPSTSKAATGSNTQYKEEDIQHLILEQLQRVNQRLDKVEGRMDKDQRDSKDRRTEKRPKKLSSFSKRHKLKQSDSSQTSAESTDDDQDIPSFSKRHKLKQSDSSQTSAECTDDDQDIPSLHSIRQSGKIQRQVDARIRELEQQSQSSGSVGKIKSKRGGNVEVVVKHRVAWPHESILGGVTRSRMSYDQLTMSQWVQGFCKNILDESDSNIREKMIQYMEELMEDATDFSWQGAKAAHAVLLCEFERGGGTNWEDTARIDRIRRAHAQKRISGVRNWAKSEKIQKPWYCKQFQSGSCTHNRDHEVNGKLHKHICSFCLSQGRLLGHAEKDCIFVKKSSTKNE